jgi:hypothetical protein
MKSMLLNLWAWVLSDPLYALATVGVGIVLAWKALPARLREAAELRSPRIVGAIRTLVALLPDLIGAARIVRYQAVGGQPRSIVSDRAAEQANKLREVTEPKDPPPASPGYSEQLLLVVIGGITLVVFLGAALTGCSPTLPADLYRGVGIGVAVTAAGGRELALLEARECLAKPSRSEAEACLVPWRARWSSIAQAWQGAASRSQSLAHVVASVDAQLERRWPAMDAGGAADAAAGE